MRKLSEEVEDVEMDHDPYEICPNGKLRCFCKIDGEVVICQHSPCNLSKDEIGTHERIIDYYMGIDEWDDAYYYFKSLIDKHVFNCNLTELESLKRENPNYTLKDLPPACRIFYFGRDLKEIKESIEIYDNKKFEDLGVDGKKVLNASKMMFMNKMNSSLHLLNHIVKDEMYKNLKKEQAQERILTKIEAMGKYGVQYTAQFGKEVDKSNIDDEKILFGDDPELRKDTGIFGKEREQIKKEEMEEKKEEKKRKGAIT